MFVHLKRNLEHVIQIKRLISLRKDMIVGNGSREIKIGIEQTGTVNDNYNTTIISTRAAAVLCIGRPPTSVLVWFSLSFPSCFSHFV